MKLPKGTAVYIHSSIGRIDHLDLCIRKDPYGMVVGIAPDKKIPVWHVKSEPSSVGWYLLEIVMPGKMTEERKEFFLSLAHAIDWSQHEMHIKNKRII